MKKLFGSLNLTWPKLIIISIVAGVYTGVVAMIPAFRDTSFRDISIYFDFWILMGIIIITNSNSPLDSALKCYVFFQISQPLVYLVQVPFNDLGWQLFNYYHYWFIWTLLTIPMGYIGYWCIRKNDWLALAVLSPMILMTVNDLANFLSETLGFFPHHLISVLFCLAMIIIYPLCILKKGWAQRAGLALSIVLALFFGYQAFRNPSVYKTQVLASNGSYGLVFDDSYKAYLSDESFGEAEIVYVSGIEDYMVQVEFHKLGTVDLIVEAPDGTKTVFELTVGRDTYDIRKK